MRQHLCSLQHRLRESVGRISGRYLQTKTSLKVADKQYTKLTSWFDRNIIIASGPLRAMTTSTTDSTTSNKRRQGGTKSNESEQEDDFIDNPCWGSPTQCDLLFLLSRMDRQASIIFESPNYVVLSKPPDLRMDGPYPSTVHKLLTYWYPPNSLRSNSNSNQGDVSLLEAVSNLHQHNSLEDNELRPCHQLDYATSGVLLVARTSAAAAVASNLMEDRVPEKTYLAVLEGHVPDAHATLPSFSQEHIDATLGAIEAAYRHSRRPQRKNDTFQGFQPPHAIFHKWKSIKTSKKKKRKRPAGISLSEDQWQEIYKPIEAAVIPDSIVDTDWKQVSLEWRKPFQQAADMHNDLLRKALAVEAQDSKASAPTLPTVFRGTDDQCLYIFAPLAQVPHDFSMRVPCTIDDHDRLSQWHGPPDSNLDYKPSLTKCEILERTVYKGQPVTKVQLSPKTGRRHQLRVHTALVGHAILGDSTYNTTTVGNDQAAPRMCLHAYSLAMPILGEAKDWKVSAPDPFPLQDGELKIVDF
jgi:23S rRNA-/tRNA-specific pseudouridylate synthase